MPAPFSRLRSGSGCFRPHRLTAKRSDEAGKPPGEEPRHAVDARAADAELVAHVQHRRPAHRARCSARCARRPDDGAGKRKQDDEPRADQAEGERAVARQSDLREVNDEDALAYAPAVERDRQRLHQDAQRHHQEAGGRSSGMRSAVRHQVVVADEQRLQRQAAGEGEPDDADPAAVDVHRALHDLETLAGERPAAEARERPSSGARFPAGRRRRPGPRTRHRGRTPRPARPPGARTSGPPVT